MAAKEARFQKEECELQLTPTKLTPTMVESVQQQPEKRNDNNAELIVLQQQRNNSTIDNNGMPVQTTDAAAAVVPASAEAPRVLDAKTIAKNAAATIIVSHDQGNAKAVSNAVAVDTNACLQNSLEQMQLYFKEMVDLILGKLDEMNNQIEELEKILMETQPAPLMETQLKE